MSRRIGKAVVALAAATALCATAGAPLAQAALSPIAGSPIGGPGSAESRFSGPVGVDVNPVSGDVYVADTNNNRVQRFDAQGTFISAFGWGVDDGAAALQICTAGCEAGISGSGDGQLATPAGIAVDSSSGDVYVGSADDGRITQFHADGAFVQAFSGQPVGRVFDTMAFSPSGLLHVVTPFQTLVFDGSGVAQPDFPASVTAPIAADFDSAGRLYVSETNGDGASVRVFDGFGEIFPRLLPGAHPSALAVDRSRDHLLVGQAGGGFGSPELTLSELETDGDVLVHGLAAGSVQRAAGSAYNAAASLPGTEGGAYYVADDNADRLVILSSVPAAPKVQSNSVVDVSASGAALTAVIDPNYRQTTYKFEYGPTSAYGASSPLVPGSAGSDGVEHAVRTSIEGLAPQTTYHYRVVATNSVGTTRSADRTLTTDPLGSPFALPDNRAWEQVSPIDKSDNEPQNSESTGGAPSTSMAAALSGVMSYATVGAFPGAEASTRSNVARSIRSAQGWTTTNVDPPIHPPRFLATGNVHAVSADLSHAVVQTPAALTADAVDGEGHLYLRDNVSGRYTLLASNPDPSFAETTAPSPVIGGSDNFDHLVLGSALALTPDATDAAPGAPPGTRQVYEWTAETGLRLVPDSEGSFYDPGASNYYHPVASSGRRFVYFKTDGSLHLRENGSDIEVAPALPLGKLAAYWGMNKDGSKIVFTSDDQLTPEARPGNREVYRYDADTGELETVTAGLNVGAPGDSQTIRSVVSVSADAETIAFTAQSNPGGVASTPMKLYVVRGGRSGFVMATYDNYSRRDLAASPNGRFLVVASSAPLTDQSTGGFEQLYRVDADTDQTVCVSCRPSGAVPTSASSLNNNAPKYNEWGAVRNVLDDGRVFFETRDPLVAGDSNGKRDVYQWSDAGPRLISDGSSNTDSYFADASADGTDVYFTTRARLVGQDRDNYVDVYDARVGGGLAGQNPAPKAPPCAGEACQGPVPPVAELPTLGSITFSGLGNEAAATPVVVRRKVSASSTGKGSIAKVKVKVPSAGAITVSGSGVAPKRQAARKAGTYSVTVSLTKKARQRLARTRTLKLVVRVRFAPQNGVVSSASVRVTLNTKGRR